MVGSALAPGAARGTAGPTSRFARHLHLAEVIRFREGQTLFDEGQRTPRGLYWLESGRVKFSLLTSSGVERVVGFAGAGAVFGEESVLEEVERPVMCQATSDGVAYFFDWAAIRSVLRGDPDLALELLSAMARKLVFSVRLVEEMTFLGVKDRVARTLARLATGGTDLGMATPARAVEVTHQELASMVGASRVMVSHALAELREEGVIEQHRRKLVVRDLASLRLQAGLGHARATPVGDP